MGCSTWAEAQASGVRICTHRLGAACMHACMRIHQKRLRTVFGLPPSDRYSCLSRCLNSCDSTAMLTDDTVGAVEKLPAMHGGSRWQLSSRTHRRKVIFGLQLQRQTAHWSATPCMKPAWVKHAEQRAPREQAMRHTTPTPGPAHSQGAHRCRTSPLPPRLAPARSARPPSSPQRPRAPPSLPATCAGAFVKMRHMASSSGNDDTGPACFCPVVRDL